MDNLVFEFRARIRWNLFETWDLWRNTVLLETSLNDIINVF